MPNNFIQRPRMFNPAQSYQRGAVNRANYETGQQNQQINAFNLQRAQDRAPMQDEQDRLQMQKTVQGLDAGRLQAATVKAQQLQRGLGSFMDQIGAMQDPNQIQDEYTAFRSTVVGMGANPDHWPLQYDPRVMQQQKTKLYAMAGEMEKEKAKKLGMTGYWGLDENDQPVLMQLDPSGGAVRADPPPGVRYAEPQRFENLGTSLMPVGTKTGTRGEPVPLNVAGKAKETELGKGAGKIATAAFNRLPAIQANIRRLDRAVGLIDKGANTGVIQSMMPTFKAASVQLEQLRSELGLDVVGAVTFGALSKGELDLALDVALPDKLSPPELRSWLINKRGAQQKLWDYLKEQATFLSKGENTVSDWYTFKEQAGTSGDPSGRQDGTLHVDAQGNRAWVYPDGSYKEVE